MTTEDIRVIRPTCEKLFGSGIRKDAEMSIMLVNYFLARPDEVLPIEITSCTPFIEKLYKSQEFKTYLKTSKFRNYYRGMTRKELFYDLSLQIEQMVSSFFCEMYDAIAPYIKTPEPDRNVYIFEGRFFEQFSKVSVKNLTTDHLPQKGSGCIVLPRSITVKNHRLKIDEVIFSVGNNEFRRSCLMAPIDNDIITPNNPSYNGIKDLIKECGTATVSFAGIDTKEGSVGTCGIFPIGNNSPIKVDKSTIGEYGIRKGTKDSSAFELVTNLMAYINSGKPDIREFRNTIRYRGKSTVHVRPEDEELSRGKVFLVGFNWLKNPVYAIDGWWSSGFMAWRMCGPGRTEPRLVYFKGSFKQRRKGREDVVTEESATEGEDFEEC